MLLTECYNKYDFKNVIGKSLEETRDGKIKVRLILCHFDELMVIYGQR